MASKQVLKVVRANTREVVHTVDVTGRNERAIERIMIGMLTNMSDEYFIDDSEAYKDEGGES